MFKEIWGEPVFDFEKVKEGKINELASLDK